MGLFTRDHSQRDADDAIAHGEVDRLAALSPKELAVQLMPAFGPDGAASKGRAGTPPMQIIQWLAASIGRGANTKPLVPAVLAGLQALEHAGLVSERTSGTGSGGKLFLLTPQGEKALADGTAATYLDG
jgi:hypothetical protein